VSHRAWIGAVGDSQSGRLGDLANHHLTRILVELEDMRRGGVCGDTGGRYGRRFDIDAGGGNRVDEFAAGTGRELHGTCCRGTGERQADLRRCAGPRAAGGAAARGAAA
jgi:hypothetical protein